MMNPKVIKALGLAATVIGLGATLLGNWVAETTLDIKIEEKVHQAVEALAKANGEKS